MAKTLTQVKEEYEKKQKTKKTLDQVRYSHEKEKIKSDISAKIKDYEAEVKKYGDIYNSTFFDESGKAKTGYISDIKEKGKAANVQSVNIFKKRKAVEDIVNKWSQYLDKDYQASIKKYFEDSNSDLTKLSKDLQSSFDYFSNFDNEDDYKGYLEYQKVVEEKNAQEKEYLSNYDAEASKKELDKLASLYNHYTKTTKKSDWGKTNRELMQYGFTSVDKLEKAYKAKEEEYGLYTALSEKHKTKKSPALQLSFGNKEEEKGLENAKTTYVPGTSAKVVQGLQREKGEENLSTLKEIANIYDTNSASGYVTYNNEDVIDYNYYEANPEVKFVTFATDEEYDLYSRLLKQGDKSAAEAYAKSLDNELNSRMIYHLNESVYQKSGDKYALAFSAGINSAFENAGTYFDSVVNTIKGNELEANIPIEQQVFSNVAASSKGVQKTALEAINTTSAMLPAVGLGLVPGVGGVLSQGMLFSQAAGGAVAEAKAKGYNDAQAMQYGTMVGASELLMEKFLGGLPGISKLSKVAENTLSQLDNVFLRVAGRAGMSGVSEFFEEDVQAYLEPYIATIVSGEDYDPPTLLEAMYQGLLGLLSGVGLSTATAIPTEMAHTENTRNVGRDIKNTPELYDGLVELGANIPEARKAAERAQKKNSDYNVGMLYSAVEKAVTPNKEEWGQRLAETEKDVYNAVSASSVVSEEAARRINGSFASSINTTPLPEDIKALVAESFFLPSDIDPNSYAAVEYARDFAEDAATAFEAGQKQIETKQTLDIEKLQEITSVATPEQLEYFMTLGKESVLSKKTYKTSAAEQPQTATEKKTTAPEGVRKAALAKRLAPANEDLIKATKADTSLNKTQKRAAEIGEKLGVAVIYDDTTKYYTSKRDGAFFKNRNVVLIDKNTINPVKQVFVHEITHFSEKSKYYAALSEKVFRSKALDKWLSDKGYTEKTLIGKISSYRNAKKSVYEQAGENLTKEGADAELIANFLADTVGTEEKFDSFMSELTSEEKKTFLDWLKEIITRIYDAFSGSIPSELREIEKLYKKALTEAGEGVKNRKNSRTAPDISFSISGGIDSYTEKQYNTFGWATYNGYITAKEREQAFSNFADYKKRRYKFKETDRGEVIFPVGDSETTIVFIDKNSSMSYPNITRVIKINTGLDFYNQEILEELFKYYGSKYKTLSNQAISNYIRQEFFIQHTRRDGSSFVEYSKRQKDEQGNQTSNSSPREQQDGRRGNRSSEETGRTSESGTITEGVQHSIPENGLTPRVEEKGGSIPERTRRLEQRFADGEIDFEELVKGEAELMNEAREKYGVIEEGENAEVEANVPTAVENNKVNSKYVRTILETGAVSDALARQLGAKTLLGDFSHTPISDKEAIAEANEAIKQNTAENKWGKTVESIHSVPSKYDLAIGEQLLANALKEGKTTKAIEIASDLVDVYTRAGQALQSARLLKKLTGVGRLVQMQRAVNQINKDIKKRSKKHPEIEISGSLAEELANAKTPEDVDSIAKDIETDIASQMKVTWLDTLNAWRYLCMLANPITHVRNFVGNMIFVPSVQARRALQYVMEKALPAEQRTIAYKIDDKYKEFAEKAVNDTTVRSVLDGTDKYSAKTKAMMKRKVLPRPIQAIYEKNSELLGGEDMWYKTRYYKNALASYLQARQIDLDKITETEIAKASQYAITEAMKNTYADESALAGLLNKLKSTNALGYLAVEGIVPFRKTPINIIKRGIEYSPFGLVNTLTFGTAKLKKGDITASEYIYGLSAGGSGTIAFVMGMFLAAIGAASGGFGDDDESKYRKLLGEQAYALIIGDRSYTLDWAAPINIPFFMGVELMKQLETQKDDVKFAEAISQSAFAVLDPIINLSMLSGLQRTFQAFRYGEGTAAFGAIAESMVTNYVSQFIPAVGGKVTSFVSEDRKANYIDKNSQLPSFVQSILNSMMAKSIFFDDRNPYIDAWGRTVSQGNVGERFLENFVSPGYFNKTDYTIVDVALMELYEETGEMGILPDAAGKYFAVDGVRKDLTADEYTKYAKAKGQYSFALIKEFFDSDISKELTAEEKVKTIKKIYEYATDKAKAVVSDYNVEKNNKTAYGEEKAGRSVAQYFAETVEAEKYAPKLFNQALENGNTEEIIQLKKDILSYKKESGDTAKEALQSLRQSVTSYWKPKYIDAWVAQDSAEMKRITKALEASGLYDNVRTTKEKWYTEYQNEQRKSK